METNFGEFKKELDGFLKEYEKEAEEYKKAIEELNDKSKKLSKERKKELEGQKDKIEKEFKKLEERKKKYDEIVSNITKVRKEQKAKELLDSEQHSQDLDVINSQDLERQESNAKALITVEEDYLNRITGVNNLKKTEAEKAAEAKAKEDEKKIEEYKKEWESVQKKTENYTKDVNAATTTVLDASSKFIDGEIARYKEKLDAVTKKLANVQKEIALMEQESAKVLAEAKQEKKKQLANEVDGDSSIAAEDKDARKNELYAELEELEFYHKQKAEIEEINAEREKLGMEERAALTTDQTDRYNELMGKHADYAQSLDTKSQADAEAQKKEKDLNDEKDKLEKKIAKEESKKKKIEFSKQIISASINIAQGVTKALAMGPIIGPIMASILGAAGAVQLSLMSAKSKKFEDGGLLSGKRHSQGGMPILGSNIEVEGGEYVVNRESTDKNLGLIRYINSQRRQLAPADLNGFFSKSAQGFEPPFRQAFAQGGQLPSIEPTTNIDNELLVQAIQSIKFEPKVSVTDINTAQTDVVQVDAWTGM